MYNATQTDGKNLQGGKNRIIEMDYLKVLAIIFMTIIHVMELCCRDYPEEVLPKGNFQFVLSFLLMICTDCFVISIGFGYSYTRNKAPGTIARRGCRLIVLGYILNFLRAGLPYAITSMLRAEFDLYAFLEYLLIVDVLQFAGAAYLLLALLSSLHIPQWTLIPLSLLLQAVGVMMPSITRESPVLNLLLPYFAETEISYFPLPTCLIYITAGICLGDACRNTTDREALFRRMLIMSCVGILALIAEASSRELNAAELFFLYPTNEDGLLVFLFDTMTVALFLSALHYVHKMLHSEGLDAYMKKTAGNLNTIYLLHWIIVCWVGFWVFDYMGMEPLTYTPAAIAGLVLSLICIGITNLMPEFRFAK